MQIQSLSDISQMHEAFMHGHNERIREMNKALENISRQTEEDDNSDIDKALRDIDTLLAEL